MPQIRTSFYYDPIRQGYDTNSWRTITGAPTIVNGGRLKVDSGTGVGGSTVHYVDFTKGDIVFNVNTAGPAADTSQIFGVVALNTSAFIRFNIAGSLYCETSDGVNTTISAPLVWSSAWASANIEFKIRWEAGGAKFFIGGTQVYAVSDASVPYGPLSLYLSDDSAIGMTIGDVTVRETLSLVVNPKTSDTTTGYGVALVTSSPIVVTEGITMKIPTLVPTFFESVTVVESTNLYITSLKMNVSEAITVNATF